MRQLIFILAVFVSALINVQACAQTGLLTGAVTTYLAGRTAKSLIEDLKRQSQQLLDQGSEIGNGLLTRFGNEGSVLAANVAAQLDAVLDDSFDKLNDEERGVLVEAEKFRRTLVDVTPQVYDIKNTTVLDLNQIVEELPFVKRRLFVQQISGIAYLPQNGDYEITIYASVQLASDSQVSVKVDIEGHEVTPSMIDMTTAGKIRLSLPNAELKCRQSERKLVAVPTTIHLQETRKEGFVIKRDVTLKLDVPLMLTLYPRVSGTAVVMLKVPTYKWTALSTKTATYTTPNRNCAKHCQGQPTRGPNHIQFAVSGGPDPHVGSMRLSEPKLTCIGGNCAFSHVNSVALTDDYTRAYADWDTWSTPGTYQLQSAVEEYVAAPEAEGAQTTIDLPYREVVSVIVPKARSFTKVQITTFSGETREVLVEDVDPLLEFKKEVDAGTDAKTGVALSRIIWQVNEPQLH